MMVNSANSTNVVTIKSGTVITLQPVQELNAMYVMNGQTVDFKVSYDVKVDKKVVIPAGSIAKGVILKTNKPKIFGKAASIEIQIKEVTTYDDQVISLSGDPIHKEGTNRVALSWILFGISMIVLWPLIFIPFFTKGDNIIIPTGMNFDFTTAQPTDIYSQYKVKEGYLTKKKSKRRLGIKPKKNSVFNTMNTEFFGLGVNLFYAILYTISFTHCAQSA